MQGVSRNSLAAAKERLDDALAVAGSEAMALGDELFAVTHVLDRAPSLRRALSDPSASAERKSDLMRSLLSAHVGRQALDILDAVARAPWARPLDVPDAVEVLAVIAVVTSAERDGRIDDLEDELFRFGRIVEGQPQLRSGLSDPSASADRKSELLRGLLADRATSATLRLTTEVAVNPRNRGLDRGLEYYSRLVTERRRRLVAVVRSAVALSEQQRRRLAEALAAAYGHEIHLNIEIDPDVIGGLTVRVENDVIDGTVAGRLDEIRRRLGAAS